MGKTSFTLNVFPAGGYTFAADAKKYHKARLGLYLAGLALDLAFLAGLHFSGASFYLRDWVSVVWPHPQGTLCVYLSLFFLLQWLIFLPLRYLGAFRIEKQHGLGNESFVRWALDESKKTVLSYLFFLGTLLAFYAILALFPGTWWLWLALGSSALTVVLMRVFPTWIIPLFYPVKEIKSEAFRDELIDFCKTCGVTLRSVYEITLSRKTKKANAALVGIGKSRRVLLGDTLLGKYTNDEIKMVLAHELGHHAKKHLQRGIVLEVILSFAGFYLLFVSSAFLSRVANVESIQDPGMLPFLLLLAAALNIFFTPFKNSFSRHHENEADDYAYRHFPDKHVFRSLMNKLGSQNLADPHPHPLIEFLLYDHPSIQKRIARIERLDKETRATP